MSERAVRLGTAVLATVGAAIAGYLLYIRWTGGSLVCSTSGCETVQSSRYAETFGIPVAALGLVAYVGVLATAAARGELARLSEATLALSALLFSGYLLVLQFAAIGAVCQWCVASDAVTTAIAALALLRLRFEAVPVAPQPPPRPRARRRHASRRRPRRRV